MQFDCFVAAFSSLSDIVNACFNQNDVFTQLLAQFL